MENLLDFFLDIMQYLQADIVFICITYRSGYNVMKKVFIKISLILILLPLSCLVEEKCVEDTDCQQGHNCIEGECVSIPDDTIDTDNLPDQVDPDTEAYCPSDMVNIENRYCIDKYEASRGDASDDNQGTGTIPGDSRPGVIPWWPVNYEIAYTACQSIGKRLCNDAEFQWVCMNGSSNTVYPYGNNYTADICNGIDAFCLTPYSHCWSNIDDPANYHHSNHTVMPTGSFEGCISQNEVYDLSGNLWELVVDSEVDSIYYLMSGAYNCIDSESLHKCATKRIFSTGYPARGFRCCKDIHEE